MSSFEPAPHSVTLHEKWMRRLDEAKARFVQQPDGDTRAAYRRLLRAFTNLVLTGRMPEDETQSGD
jgi:hypothetical protein